jgi:hypothetical protein
MKECLIREASLVDCFTQDGGGGGGCGGLKIEYQ